MTLLEECLEVLGENANILINMDKEKINSDFISNFNITFYGRINWEDVGNKRTVSVQDLSNEDNDLYYIIWSDPTLPIVQCRLYEILKYIDDVTAVSFDTWLFSKNADKIIEFYHENEITIGYKVN